MLILIKFITNINGKIINNIINNNKHINKNLIFFYKIKLLWRIEQGTSHKKEIYPKS